MSPKIPNLAKLDSAIFRGVKKEKLWSAYKEQIEEYYLRAEIKNMFELLSLLPKRRNIIYYNVIDIGYSSFTTFERDLFRYEKVLNTAKFDDSMYLYAVDAASFFVGRGEVHRRFLRNIKFGDYKVCAIAVAYRSYEYYNEPDEFSCFLECHLAS